MSQRVQQKNFEMDMTNGPLFKKLVLYALPLIGTNLLQMLFNAADIVILGIFASDIDVGAVGATTPLINLIIAVFVGLSSGASVVLSKCMGAGDVEGAHRTVGTSIVISLISGIFLLVVGVTCSRLFLEWMSTTPEQIDGAVRYMTIYFIGVPIIMLYNFIASILRAVGDTLRPLIYLLIGGLLNIGLNIFCILVLNLTVEGVAIATVASQLFSVVLSLIAILKSNGYGKLKLKYLKIYKKQLKEIILIGLPSGIQGALFNVANVFIQSNINNFGHETVTANTAAQQLDGMLVYIGNGFSLACMAFVSQNFGAGKIDRIKKVFWQAVFLGFTVVTIMGVIFVLLSEYMLRIITVDPVVIKYAKIRLTILGLTYGLCSIMECFSYSMRAMNKSLTAMIISLICICGVRLLWLNTAFIMLPTREMLYYAWPLSWALSIIVYSCFYFPLLKKVESRMPLKIPPKQLEAGQMPPKQRPNIKYK